MYCSLDNKKWPAAAAEAEDEGEAFEAAGSLSPPKEGRKVEVKETTVAAATDPMFRCTQSTPTPTPTPAAAHLLD
jgi:hypothetical protein